MNENNQPQSQQTKREYVVRLTRMEIDALYSTADQMRDNMDYYDFKGPKRAAKFCDAYNSAMQKLQKLL